MGGNALKNVETGRLDRAEFEPYQALVLEKLKELFPDGRRFDALAYYHNKPSFGDLDILVEKPKPDKEFLVSELKRLFDTKEIYHNSDYISFEFNKFQVDLIFTPTHEYDASKFYFSYNDLNNLTGRTYHKLGLKLGHDGLTYPAKIRYPNETTTFMVSTDFEKVYSFIGLDYNTYLKGFDELEDIFKFVVSTPYFSADIFDYEALNHINRIRNKKRATYQKFLSWMEENQITTKYNFLKDKNEYFPKIAAYFPEADLVNKFAELDLDVKRRANIKSKFNGKLIMEWIPELHNAGNKLGAFIRSVKDSMTNFDDYAEESSAEQVREYTLSLWQNLR